MLGQHHRRCPSIKSTLIRRLLSAGWLFARCIHCKPSAGTWLRTRMLLILFGGETSLRLPPGPAGGGGDNGRWGARATCPTSAYFRTYGAARDRHVTRQAGHVTRQTGKLNTTSTEIRHSIIVFNLYKDSGKKGNWSSSKIMRKITFRRKTVIFLTEQFVSFPIGNGFFSAESTMYFTELDACFKR